MKRSLFLLLTILTLLFLASCGGPGGTDPIDPTDPTTTTDPTDPTTTTDPTDPTTTTDPTFPFPVDPVDPTTTTDPTSPTTIDMTGTWTGTTTTTSFGTLQTEFVLTQSGSQISGTLDLAGENVTFEQDNPIEGSVSGSTVTISARYQDEETGEELEFAYNGTSSGTTVSGGVTLNFSSGSQESGTFTITNGGSTIDPSDPTVTTDPTDPSSGISGTVTAGIDVTGTIVGACSDQTCTNPIFASPLPLDSTGAYSITGLQAVPYTVVAVQDTNGSGTFDAGDYLGGVENVTPPATGVSITLQPYTGSESPIAKQLSEKLINSGKIQQYKRAP